MKPHLRRITALALPLAVLFLSTCTVVTSNEDSSTGGTGSEVVGVVEYPDSSATAKRLNGERVRFVPLIDGGVFINPRDYLAEPGHGGEKSKTTTESDGSFRIENVVSGDHLLYVRDNSGNAVAYAFTARGDEQERINLGTLYAKKTAGVSIQYTGNIPGDVLFYIDVKGTGIQMSCSNRNLTVTLGSIPTGIDHTITVRLKKPVNNDYEFGPIALIPGVVTALQSITGD